MPARIDMIGRVFGGLTVKSEAEPYYRSNGAKLRRYLCVCECGGAATVVGQNLRSGTTKSCGCKSGGFKHGHRKAGVPATVTHNTWSAMRARCNNPKHLAYPRYGGKGVRVCAEWNDQSNGFSAFLRDMGERPIGHTLDRIDNQKGYAPDNCRWATPQEQYENKRVVRGPDGKFI